MEQTWALGTVVGSPRSIEFVNFSGELSVVSIDALRDVGVPNVTRLCRLPYEGEFSQWEEGAAENYLEGLCLRIGGPVDHRHQVLVVPRENGKLIHVPALVLIRAFYKPAPIMFPALFHPVGMDLLSFVDRTSTPAEVVADGLDRRYSIEQRETAKKVLPWLQLSRSAETMTQSVWRNACEGYLGFSRPLGRTRIVFHGLDQGNDFFATKAMLLSVSVLAEDSVTGRSEQFFLHGSVDPDASCRASVQGVRVPLHRDGTSGLTLIERELVEAVLRGRTRRSDRALRWDVLNVVLEKLSTGRSWKSSTTSFNAVSQNDAVAAFRRWYADGRLGEILQVLEGVRGRESLEVGAELA
ncbi:hypothetical protein [Castellaniella sp.]|uniref:hypothetical protein n=1 Tax=Castellaniella sp. TaxID=1955812 RepID=UPI003C70DDD8